MNMNHLVSHLRARKIELWIEQDQLRFNGPKSELTEEMMTILKANKSRLLAFVEEFGPVRAVKELVAQADDSDAYALSPDQEPLWFLDQFRGGSPSDHLCRAFQISGTLDANAMESAFHALADRHESLRTVFSSQGTTQSVLSSIDWKLERIDLTSMPSESSIAETKRSCGDKSRERFDLERGPLFRACLFEWANDQHVLLFVMHHIIGDGHSLAVLAEELGELYTAKIENREPYLPRPVRQYKDFANYRREQSARQQESDADAGYWQDRLKDFGQVVQWPLDHQRPAMQTALGAREYFEMDPAQCQQLREVGRRQGATLFMTVLAAFYALMKRHTGQSDLIVGAPVSLRDRVEFDTMIGMCLNMSVLAVDAADDLTYRDLLDRVRDTTTEAMSHQSLPFQELVNAVRPERDLSRNQIFQVLFQVSPFGSLAIDGLDVVPFDFDPGTAQFDMSVHLFEHQGGLRGFIEYDSDIFKADRISRTIEHLQVIANAVSDNPDQRIAHLPLMPDSERDLVLESWNDTKADYPRDRCLHQLFEDQARQAPEKVAVVFESESITYRQLNERADRLADHLMSAGVENGSFVGINMSRSIDMVVAMFGILKTGGAYLPLDPSFPAERLNYMLQDSETKIVLTDLPGSDRVDAAGVSVVDFKEFESQSSQQDGADGRPSSSDDLAYMIYTSGSTGRPKGVQIQHRSVVNFLTSMSQQPGLSKDDRLLAITTLSFDISVLEIFLPLCFGAELHVAGDGLVKDADRLREYLVATKPTVMQATPTTWQMLIDCGWNDDQDLKKLCGGEPMPLSLAKQLSAMSGSLWNMYGPTETTIWSSVRRIHSAEEEVLIGGPILNTQFYVVDSNFQPVPIGVPGELVIGGDGLAVGYWKREELTQDRFVPNPLSPNLSSRLYRTGDLVRQTAEGMIQFVGRLDFQVKVRGYRIELGEIERVLIDNQAVKEAVVIVSSESDADKKLVAYYIAQDSKSLPFDVDQVRDEMRDKLPAYMIPALFIPLTEWPLTPNGKIDRKRLPAPVVERRSGVHVVEPEDPVEQDVAEIWKALLNVEMVGVDENFFDLGGNSLLVVKMRSELEDKLGVQLMIADLFASPTIRKLGKFLNPGDNHRVEQEKQNSRLSRKKQALGRMRRNRSN